MKKGKITALILCAVLLVGMLAGCGAEKAAEEEKTLVVATHATFPPYEFYEGDKIVGIDIEIMQAIADKIGYDMEVVDMEFGSIITAVATGKADVGAAGITKTEERAKSVNFTESYATGIQSVIVKDGGTVATLEDLKGEAIKIGVQQDTTGDIYATGEFGEDHMVRFNKGADAVQALSTGKCDAVIIDNGPAQVFVDLNEGLSLLDSPYTEEEYSYEISYDNQELYELVNNALKELQADGTVQAIIDKYISAE